MHLIGPFSQILSLDSLSLKGPLSDSQLEIIVQGGVLVEGDMIVAVGEYETLRARADTLSPISQPMVLLPGWIDAHTHICYGGSRARDYALRSSGVSYLEIARQGGGIWSTVEQTRAASMEQLVAAMSLRAAALLRQGVTTAEVKSGYGLSVEAELSMLRAIRACDAAQPVDLLPTCLAAHTLPRDFGAGAEAYLVHLLAHLLPQVRAEGLSHRVDIFIEETAFGEQMALSYLRKAREMGFETVVHADQFHPGGSAVAIAAGARSADHLEASGPTEVAALAESEVVAMALPGASLGLGMAFTPARALLDAGACLAIATDWNPGSAPMGDLLTQTALLGIYERLSTAELLAGITFRAAHALGLSDRGVLAPGKRADMIAFPTADFREILYRQGSLKPANVWKNGQSVKS